MIRLTTTLPRAWNFERNISSTRSCEKPRRSQDPRALKIPDVVLDSSNDLSTISGKLVEKIRPKKGSAPAPSLLKTPEDAMSSLHQIVTGWGEDKLAPPTSSESAIRQKLHLPDIETSLNKELAHQSFTKFPRTVPLFDRRIQVLVEPDPPLKTLETIEPPEEQRPVSALSHSLDRVLFNSGSHWLRDPRSNVYNFPSELETIPPINDFDFDRLSPYITSSRDENLLKLAKREGKQLAGSTSSLTTLLSHVYFLISNDRPVDTSYLSAEFQKEPKKFSPGARFPGIVRLTPKDGVYLIDSGESVEPEKNLLLNMGTMLEKFLTYSTSDFSKLLRSSSSTGDPEEFRVPETYRYSKSDHFVMRAQLDAQDSRLPGTGVFDIKTRAAVAIRYDPLNYEANSSYMIRHNQGLYESFEREYYDLVRSAFLKYGFQVRIGDMDGIFVAYHNTALLFGFQYISRDEMDSRLFGGPLEGARVFDRCVKCLEEIILEVISCYPEVPVKCYFETVEETGRLNVYVQPQEWPTDDPPITKLLVSCANYVNGLKIEGPMDFGGEEDSWKIMLSISRSNSSYSALQETLHIEKEAIEESATKFRFWLPPGVNATQMAERWVNIDFTGKTTVSSDSLEPSEGNSTTTSAEDLALLALRFKGRDRAPFHIQSLRKMAKRGKSEQAPVAAGTTPPGETTPDGIQPESSHDEASAKDPDSTLTQNEEAIVEASESQDGGASSSEDTERESESEANLEASSKGHVGNRSPVH